MEKASKRPTAGVIGTNWGRVHVAGLRKAGCEVTALMAHDAELAARIAAEEQIAHSGSSLEVLADCDWVTIATPTASHLGYLQRLATRPVLCEKPLGLTPDNQHAFDALTAKDHFISYPFPFLDAASVLRQQLHDGQLGALTRICLVVGVNLPYPKTPVEWFAEDVVHPFSLLYTLFDDFEFCSVRLAQGNNMTVQYRCQGALFDILLCDWPKPGLHFDVTIVGTANAYQLRGGFRPERGWWFEPLLADGHPISEGEPVHTNPWMEANYRVMAAVKAHLDGDVTEPRLFDVARARAMEKLFLPLWQADRSTATHAADSGLHWALTPRAEDATR